MVAFYECPLLNCHYPLCNRMMSVMEGVSLDANGNPLYTAICERMGEVVGDVRQTELIYGKEPSGSEDNPIENDAAEKNQAQMSAALKPVVDEMSRQARAFNRQAKAFDDLRKELRGESSSPHEMSPANKSVVKMAIDARSRMISEGVSERNATTDACREVEQKFGIGEYASFEAFRDAVNTKVKTQEYSHGVREILV